MARLPKAISTVIRRARVNRLERQSELRNLLDRADEDLAKKPHTQKETKDATED